MTADEFRASLGEGAPPAGLAPALQGLWHDHRGDWDAAHRAVQEATDADSAWVHAYLHRKEGDEGNAGYWYRRAGKPHARMPLAQEWREIATSLLG